VDCRTDLIGI